MDIQPLYEEFAMSKYVNTAHRDANILLAIKTLREENQFLRQQLTKPADAELIEAAKAVVERWETPLLKDAPATAGYIYRLRDAINAYKPTEG
jgi:hypothetical protein